MSLSSHIIAKNIKNLRAQKGLTQKQLADETGLSYSSITSYENGLREPMAERWLPLSDILA